VLVRFRARVRSRNLRRRPIFPGPPPAEAAPTGSVGPREAMAPLDASVPNTEQSMPDTLTIIDNRTGRQYELPIDHGTYPEYGAFIRGAELRQIKSTDEDFGLLSYDPAFLNTASCRSAVTFIDGDRGILRYRGYDIADLASNSSYLEVAYLLLYGELPDQQQLEEWTKEISMHTMVHENVKKFMDGFRHDAHPMGMLISTVAALSTFYPESKKVLEADIRRHQVIRLIAKMPTLAAYAFRHAAGLPYTMPDNELGYAATS
jgi:citrate synthase